MDKIGDIWVKRDVSNKILDRIEERTGCELEVIEFDGDRKRVEVFGDNNCRASLQKMKLMK